MSALKSQGLSESDLLLIAAAQQRQRQNTHPLSPPHQDKYDDFFRTPFSAPAGKLEEPFGHGYAIDSQSSRASSTGVLKKFPFEIGPGPSSPLHITPTTPTAPGKVRHINHTSLKDHPVSSEFESKGPASDFPSTAESRSWNLNRTRTRSGTDSYPVSASESDIESSPLPHSSLPRPHSHYELLLPTPPSPSKRLSAQLRGFKGLRIGIDEDEEEWGKIILFAIMDSERETAGSKRSNSGWERCEPITPRGILPVSPKIKTNLPLESLPTSLADDGNRLIGENTTLHSPQHHMPIISSLGHRQQSLPCPTSPSFLPSSSKDHHGVSHSPLPPVRPCHTPGGFSISRAFQSVSDSCSGPSLSGNQHDIETAPPPRKSPDLSALQTPSLRAIGISPLEMDDASRLGRSPVSSGIFGEGFGQVQGQKNKRKNVNFDMKEDNKDDKEINVPVIIPLYPLPSYPPLPSPSPSASRSNQHPPPRISSLSFSQSHHYHPRDSLPVSADTDSNSSLLFHSRSQENVLGDMDRASLALSMESDITWRTSRTSYTAHSLRSLEPVGEATVRMAYKGLVPRPGSHLWLGQDHKQGAGVRPRTPSPMKQLINSNAHSSPLPSPSPYRPQNRPENGGHIESFSQHSALIHVDVREEVHGHGHGHGYDDLGGEVGCSMNPGLSFASRVNGHNRYEKR